LSIDAHLDKVNSSSTCGFKSLAPAAEISMRTNGSRSLMLSHHNKISESESWLPPFKYLQACLSVLSL
jgi:hypothetical protein